jgi:hypothetical protein
MNARAEIILVGGWPSKAVPLVVLRLAGESKLESPSPLAYLAGVRQRPNVIDSVRPSNGLCGGFAVFRITLNLAASDG